jgi:hypothetical protein
VRCLDEAQCVDNRRRRNRRVTLFLCNETFHAIRPHGLNATATRMKQRCPSGWRQSGRKQPVGMRAARTLYGEPLRARAARGENSIARAGRRGAIQSRSRSGSIRVAAASRPVERQPHTRSARLVTRRPGSRRRSSQPSSGLGYWCSRTAPPGTVTHRPPANPAPLGPAPPGR